MLTATSPRFRFNKGAKATTLITLLAQAFTTLPLMIEHYMGYVSWSMVQGTWWGIWIVGAALMVLSQLGKKEYEPMDLRTATSYISSEPASDTTTKHKRTSVNMLQLMGIMAIFVGPLAGLVAMVWGGSVIDLIFFGGINIAAGAGMYMLGMMGRRYYQYVSMETYADGSTTYTIRYEDGDLVTQSY